MADLTTQKNISAGLITSMLFFLVALSTALPRLIDEWGKGGNFEFIAAVILISAGFFLRAEPAEQSTTAKVSSGLNSFFPYLMLMFSILCIFADAAMEEESLLFAGIWTGLMGLVTLNTFPDIMLRLRFPVFLLIFSIPVPQYVAFYHFHYPLQRLSAIWTAGTLDLSGYEARVSGTVIDLGNQSNFHIVEECSGIKFLAILLLFAVIAGRLNLKNSIAARIALVLAAVPTAIFTNVIRLAAAGILMVEYGEKTAMEFLHGNSVLIFYAAAIFMLTALTSFLNTLLLETVNEQKVAEKDECVGAKPVSNQRNNTVFYPIIICWSIALIIGSRFASTAPVSNFYREGLEQINFQPSGWCATDRKESEISSAYTPGFASAPQARKIDLTSPSGRLYELEIVWWPQRRPRNRLIVFHQAIICSMGAYAGGIHQEMKIDNHRLSCSLINDKGQHKSFYYWLQSENKISTRPYYHAVWQYWQELLRQPSDGCFVLIAAKNELHETNAADLSALLSHIKPALQNWLSKN